MLIRLATDGVWHDIRESWTACGRLLAPMVSETTSEVPVEERCLACTRARFRRTFGVSLKLVNECPDVKSRKTLLMELLTDYKLDQGCNGCDKWLAVEDLTFHHKDPELKLGLVGRIARKRPLVELLDELDKCEVLCRVCHDEWHQLGFIVGDLPTRSFNFTIKDLTGLSALKQFRDGSGS